MVIRLVVYIPPDLLTPVTTTITNTTTITIAATITTIITTTTTITTIITTTTNLERLVEPALVSGVVWGGEGLAPPLVLDGHVVVVLVGVARYGWAIATVVGLGV